MDFFEKRDLEMYLKTPSRRLGFVAGLIVGATIFAARAWPNEQKLIWPIGALSFLLVHAWARVGLESEKRRNKKAEEQEQQEQQQERGRLIEEWSKGLDVIEVRLADAVWYPSQKNLVLSVDLYSLHPTEKTIRGYLKDNGVDRDPIGLRVHLYSCGQDPFTILAGDKRSSVVLPPLLKKPTRLVFQKEYKEDCELELDRVRVAVDLVAESTARCVSDEGKVEEKQ